MDVKTFRENIYRSALPLLEGRVVTDLVIGLSLLAVELDGKDYAAAYVMRESLGGGCSIFSYAADAVGLSAVDAGKWFVDGGDDVQRAIGCAVINAASQVLPLKDSGGPDKPFDVKIKKGDTVGMIGNIRPVAMQLRNSGCKMMIFDKGQCAKGNVTEDIYPMDKQSELLPGCDAVFLSGTTTVNGTVIPITELCPNAQDIVLIGTSTPMIPEGYAGTNVSVLAGSWWKKDAKEEVFRLISRAAGIQALGKFMVKKNVRIK